MVNDIKGVFEEGEEVNISKCSRVEKCNIIDKNGEPPYRIGEYWGNGMYYVETPKRGSVLMPGSILAKI